MIDRIFEFCIYVIVIISRLTGLSYEAVNILLFVILWPLAIVALGYVVWRQRGTIRRLKRELDESRKPPAR